MIFFGCEELYYPGAYAPKEVVHMHQNWWCLPVCLWVDSGNRKRHIQTALLGESKLLFQSLIPVYFEFVPRFQVRFQRWPFRLSPNLSSAISSMVKCRIISRKKFSWHHRLNIPAARPSLRKLSAVLTGPVNIWIVVVTHPVPLCCSISDHLLSCWSRRKIVNDFVYG